MTYQGSAPSSLDASTVGPTDSNPNDFQGKLHASTLVDLFAGYDWRRYSFELFATNVFDKRNESVAHDGLRQLHAGAHRARPAADDRHSRGDEVLARRNGRAARRLSWHDAPAHSRRNGASSSLVALAAMWLAMLVWRRRAARPRRSTKRSTPATGPRWSPIARMLHCARRADRADRRRLRAARCGCGAPGIGICRSCCSLIALLGRGLSEAQKYWIARVRPDLEPHLVVVKTSVLPERPRDQLDDLLPGARARADRRHALASRRPPRGAILLSLLIGTSRVMLGVHWPSDVDRRLGIRHAVGAADAAARRAAAFEA